METMILSLRHLRLRLDELEHLAEASTTVPDRRRLLLDVVALERSLEVPQVRSATEAKQVDLIRKRLRRLHGAG
jgi:hypothetical protein